MIKSFACETTEKIFHGDVLGKRDRKAIGGVNLVKAADRLFLLNNSDERALLAMPALYYHKLHGTSRYSIDADSRNSPWRITFCWENEEMTHVFLVKIEDTH